MSSPVTMTMPSPDEKPDKKDKRPQMHLAFGLSVAIVALFAVVLGLGIWLYVSGASRAGGGIAMGVGLLGGLLMLFPLWKAFKSVAGAHGYQRLFMHGDPLPHLQSHPPEQRSF